MKLAPDSSETRDKQRIGAGKFVLSLENSEEYEYVN